MSGLEIAGVILGAIPVVIEALAAFRAGKGISAKMTKSRILVEKLIHRLKALKISFHLDAQDLLRNAQVPEFFAEGGNPSPDRCIEILQEVHTGDEVRQYFGCLHYDFIEILKFHERCLKEISSKLSHIIRPPNVDKDDLAAIIRASRSPNATIVFKGKVRFTMDKESLDVLVDDLEREADSFGKLARRVQVNRDRELREPTSSAKTLKKAFSRVRDSAMSLYRAACECWVCDEHLHTLMMRLEHRIPKDKHRALGSSPVAFRLCFSMGAAEMQRIEVISKCMDSTNELHSTVPVACGSGLLVPSITLTEVSKAAHPMSGAQTRIKSICEGAWKAREKRQVLSLELTSCASLAVVEQADNAPHSYDMSVSLADLLKGAAGGAHLSTLEQALLALNVASSMLQLRPTMWCSVPWNSTTIRFPVQKHKNAEPVLDTPYVAQSIDMSVPGRQGRSLPELAFEAIRSTMLELAILLLEISHQKSITTWADQNNLGEVITASERMAVARHWLDNSGRKLVRWQLEAVEGCLQMHAQSRGLWDERFQLLYCENIIKPLQELADL